MLPMWWRREESGMEKCRGCESNGSTKREARHAKAAIAIAAEIVGAIFESELMSVGSW